MAKSKSNLDGWNDLQKRLAAAKGSVRVGVLGKTALREGEAESNFTNAEIAAVHEFGSSDGRIPERSFLRSTMRNREADFSKIQAMLAKKVVANKLTAEQALDQLGAWFAAQVKHAITAGIAPELAESTIKARRKGKQPGRKVPLVDTGQLRNSITWAVLHAK